MNDCPIVVEQRCGDNTRPRDTLGAIEITEDSITYRLNIRSSRAIHTTYYFFLFWTLIAELVINSISVLARTCPRLAGGDWPHRREHCWRHNHAQYVWKICTVRYTFVSSNFYFLFFDTHSGTHDLHGMTRSAVTMAAGKRDYTCESTRNNRIPYDL